jgi:hypothetical protein
MNALGNALPNYGQSYAQPPGPRFDNAASTAALAYQMQQMPQFNGHAAMNQPGSPLYTTQFGQQSQHAFPAASPAQGFYPAQAYMTQGQVPQMPYPYHMNQYGVPSQAYSGVSYAPQYAPRGSFSTDRTLTGRAGPNDMLASATEHGGLRTGSAGEY